VCRGYVDDRWYPRCQTRSNEVQITGTSKANKWSEASTVEVVMVIVRDDLMTPKPRQDSDDSGDGQSDTTESEEDKVIFSICYQCNDKVPIQMKKNGTCHSRCFYCYRNKWHLVCAAVNSDKTIDRVYHSLCEICRQYVTSGTMSNRSCHGPCKFCRSRVIHDKCNAAIPCARHFTIRATQWYPNV
jgi:hypothetical protein